jgi:hypothetical protein
LNANLLMLCVDFRDHWQEQYPEVDEKTEESVTAALLTVDMPPLEILRKRRRYMAATRLIRVLRTDVDQQG